MKLSNIVVNGTSIQVGDIFRHDRHDNGELLMLVKAAGGTMKAFNLIYLENGNNYFTVLETFEIVKSEIMSKGMKPVLSVTISDC